jgi:anaerobic selenocysteine-containing dehydrogenase
VATETTRLICTHDCPDACAVLVTVTDGVATDVRADSSHPITGRHLCVKVDRYLERVYSPDRVLTPLRRTGPKGADPADGLAAFEPTTWDSALDEIAERWDAICAEHGAEAILPYSYLGSMGVLSAMGTMHAVFSRLGATRLERTICGGQVSGLAAIAGAPWTDPERIADADLVLVWGMDPVSTSIHTWDLIRRARARGARFVVVDPYRSQTARRADLHVRIRPGTDGALALGMIRHVLHADLVDHDYVDRYTSGLDDLAATAEPWTPAATEAATDVPAETVVELAHMYATTKPAIIRYGVGMQRAAGAGMALRAIWCLPALTGQWRHPAGGVADARSMNQLQLGALGVDGPRTRSVNMIQLGRALTDPSLDPPVRSLFVWNSNPAVIAADQNRVLAGLARDDLFTVVHDQFLTDTARYADLVLPATTMLENQDLLGSWGFNYIGLGQRAIEPLGEAVSNAELARRLARRLGFDDPVFAMTDDEQIDLVLRDSPAERAGATRDRLERDGFVRVGGPADEAPFAQGGFGTESGRFEFSSSTLAGAGLPATPVYQAPYESTENDPDLAARYPLRLLTLKRHFSINSSYGSLPVLLGAEPVPVLELHPADAAARGIDAGDRVVVRNDRGAMELAAHVTDAVPAGTVAVPFGRWRRDGQGANALTSDRFGDIGHGPTFCDSLVEVSLVG